MPGSLVRSDGGLGAFGDPRQGLHPIGLGLEGRGVALAGIDGVAPHPGDVRHVARAALTTFQLDGGDPGAHDLRQQVQGVEAGGLLDGIAGLALDLIAAFADGRVAGRFVPVAPLDQDAAQAGLLARRGVAPLHMRGGRAGAEGVGRLAGGVGGQQAAPLDHHAQAAEAEDLDRHRALFDQMGDLGDGQDARYHHAADAEMPVHEADRRRTGGRRLDRQMQPQLRVALRRVVEHAHIGQDQGIHAQVGRPIHGVGPARPALGLGVGIDGDEDFDLTLAGIAQTLLDLLVAEVQSGEVTGIGVVAKADIDGVGAVVHGSLE